MIYGLKKHWADLPNLYDGFIDNLSKGLYDFGKSKRRVQVFRTNGDELRKIYKGFVRKPKVEQKPKKQKVYKNKKLNSWQLKQQRIYNSSFNRKPNLEKDKVRKTKMIYLLKMGTGKAAINGVPASRFIDKGQVVNTFYIKDRGHILEILCVEYESEIWVISEVLKLIDQLKKEIPKNTSNPNEDNIRARRILDDVKDYLKDLDNTFDKSILKSDRKFKLSELCKSVPEFNHYLNVEPFDLTVTKETIETHCGEIHALNNFINAWIDFQMAGMNVSIKDRQINGNEKYLNEILDINTFYDDCFKSDVFTRETNSICMESGMKAYFNQVAEWEHITPLFLIANTLFDFDKSAGNWYIRKGVSGQAHWTELWEKMLTQNLSYDDATEKRKLLENIIDFRTPWKEFHTKKQDLVKHFENQNPNIDSKNIKDANIRSESFGGACVVAIYHLALNQKGSEGNWHKASVEHITKKFLDALYDRLEELSNDPTNDYFSNSSMETRFNQLILPTYNEILNSSSTETKDQMAGNHWFSLKERYWDKSDPNTHYKIIPMTMESWTSKKPKVKHLDFALVENDRELSKLHLGRKTAGVSYSTDNTLIQSKYFNESVQELDQDVSNIVHWAWFAEMNMRLANKFKNDDDYLEARSDAIKLQKKFNRSKLNEEELQELKDYSEFMGNWNDVYKTNNEEK